MRHRSSAFLAFLVIGLGALFLVPNVRAATIVFDASGSPNPQSCPSGCSSISWTHTVGSGSSGILLVGVSYDDSRVPTVQFGGTTMTALGDHMGAGGQSAGLWSLAVSSGASGTVTVTFTGGPTTQIIGGSVSYFNVASTGIVASNDGVETSAASVSVSTVAGDVVVDTLSVFNGGGTVGSGQTQRWNSGLLAGVAAGGGSDEAASGSSVTMSWTLTSIAPGNVWSLVAVPLIPPATPPIPEYPLGLPLLAILTIISYGVIRRKTKNPKK